MRSRRFLILAAVLVALNTVLWLAPGALGLSQIVVSTLFGKNMVRADIVESTGCPTACVEWRLDRGVVIAATPVLLTIREVDTRVQAIQVSSSTVVSPGTGRPVPVGKLGTGWHVLVLWPANGGPAKMVWIEKRKS